MEINSKLRRALRSRSSHHMHFQRSFRVQRNPADIANVLSLIVDVFMRFKAWEVLELFGAAWEGNIITKKIKNVNQKQENAPE